MERGADTIYESMNPFKYWFIEGGVSYGFSPGGVALSSTCYYVF